MSEYLYYFLLQHTRNAPYAIFGGAEGMCGSHTGQDGHAVGQRPWSEQVLHRNINQYRKLLSRIGLKCLFVRVCFTNGFISLTYVLAVGEEHRQRSRNGLFEKLMRMKTFCIPFVLFVSILLTGCDFRSTEDYLREVDKLYEEKKYAEAIVLLDKAISRNSENLTLYINRGVNKAALEDFKNAINDYKLVLARDPKNTLALFNMGIAHNNLKDYTTAIDYFNEAMQTKGGELLTIDYAPGNLIGVGEFDVPAHEIRFERGTAWMQLDSVQRAYQDFRSAIDKHYMEPESHWWVGYCYAAYGQKDLACESFKESARLGYKEAMVEVRKYCY